MNALCPYCRATQAIGRLARFLLPARQQYPDRHAELMQCHFCQQVYLSVYEEVSSNTRIAEEWNVYHYYLPTKLQRDVLISATLCPTPRRRGCRCQLHNLISEIDFSTLQRLQSH